MVCQLITSDLCSQRQTVAFSAAKLMVPLQRRQLALETLAGIETVSHLAQEHHVSCNFVYRQAAKAEEVLDHVFAGGKSQETGQERVLFQLPVIKSWLRQAVLGLTLTCHSSFRGVVEFFDNFFDCPISVATVHNILQQAVEQARVYNKQQELAGIRIGAHDEIFQSGRPVLVGADVTSTFCYLLSIQDHRDAETWGVRLLELQDQGFAPEVTIADAGKGLRAGKGR